MEHIRRRRRNVGWRDRSGHFLPPVVVACHSVDELFDSGARAVIRMNGRRCDPMIRTISALRSGHVVCGRQAVLP